MPLTPQFFEQPPNTVVQVEVRVVSQEWLPKALQNLGIRFRLCFSFALCLGLCLGIRRVRVTISVALGTFVLLHVGQE